MQDEITIAWQGTFELKNAKWELDSGRTVEFRVVHFGEDEPVVHPFKKYQKRRGGKVGQRFHASIVPEGEIVTCYDSEMMLQGWSDNEGGRAVKFWLDHEAEHHPFAGYTKRTASVVGSMFAAVMVMLQDDGAPENEVVTDSGTSKRRFSQDAHLMVTSAMFIQYLTERCGHTQVLSRQGLTWTPELSKQWVKKKLGIESLSDLDKDDIKLIKFHEVIRKPYVQWQGKE